MSGAKRRSFEAGHRPKFMVVVDGTPECGRAIHFATRRCTRTGASLLMLGVAIPPEGFEWLGVGDTLRAEAEEETATLVADAADQVRSGAGLEPEQVVRTGEKSEAILALIEEDQDISFLVLAAGTGSSGPGPLVSAIAAMSGSTFPIPVVIVPGDLTDEEIEALAG
ncbi:MAG: universal stress protein [Methylobacteriaceae bacterium]|nr:universal stress protein [Methylobacteriaceae bacterium]